MSADNADNGDAIIVASNLRKIFPAPRGTKGEPILAVDDVSFELYPDECLAIVGESGSGKTTVARMLVGLETVTGGELTVRGESRTKGVRRLGDRRRWAREVQYVFQDPYSSLNGRQRILDIISSSVALHGGVNAKAPKRAAQEILLSVGLGESFWAKYPHQLSGGQRQRVAIARALAADPEVIVLDEAVAALDVSIQAQILNLLSDIKAARRVSYLFISHDLAVVNQISDRMIVMEQGKVVDAGVTAEILADPVQPYTRALRAAVPRPGWKPVRRERLAS
ncbi:ABC transporter ATP-binding protein [Microbacterium sp. ASV49]|uniref:ATP-binding cassette domain-containing protein n=1 Tax=Microbacterium candidum TaxID=3041922 RepID=A0ABT7N4F2_9MICO|nr:ATP-binding cassette domain-containing protein [Microbacterium sp. ASV49]MDL9981541.1 ATP-binding cassette domain-containing protein [Microbacterium sp. ASV49]